MLWLLIPMFPILVNVFIDAFINLAAICVRVYALFVKEPSHYPSGPPSLPFIGHKRRFEEYAEKGGLQRLFMRWKETYGPIMAVDFGSYKAVVLGDLGGIQEAFSLTSITGRMQGPEIQLRSSNGRGGPMRGVLFTHGQTWSEQRLFMMKHLMEYDSDRLDKMILPEGLEIVNRLNQSDGAPLATRHIFHPAIFNVIRMIVANDRSAHDDPQLFDFMEAHTEMLQSKSIATRLSYFPQWVMETCPGLTGWSKYRETLDVSTQLIINMIQETLDQKEPGSDDFIHAFTNKMKDTSDPHSSFHGDRGQENLVQMILDFFEAGVEPTSTTLSWLFLFLALHPSVQVKLQEEIDTVIGKQTPSLADRPRMRYTDAVLTEALRKSSTAPFELCHRTLETVTLGSYQIPQDTIVMGNLFGIHHDPRVWGESAEAFDPERFLIPSGSPLPSVKDTIPFGTGKRSCPGETFARATLFLFLVLTLQGLTIKCDIGGERPNMDHEVGGIIAAPKKHKLIFVPRQ